MLSGQAIQVRVCGALSIGTVIAPARGDRVRVRGRPAVAAVAAVAGPALAAVTARPAAVRPAAVRNLRRSSRWGLLMWGFSSQLALGVTGLTEG
ncbi:hypothetical protein GCM10009738_32350 [Kitasatospora viridis]